MKKTSTPKSSLTVKSKQKNVLHSSKLKKLKIFLGISILLNVLLIVGIVTVRTLINSDDGRQLLFNNHMYYMCTDELKKDLKHLAPNPGEWYPYFDFICQKNGADKYFDAGYEDYLKSLKARGEQ